MCSVVSNSNICLHRLAAGGDRGGGEGGKEGEGWGVLSKCGVQGSIAGIHTWYLHVPRYAFVELTCGGGGWSMDRH